MDNGVLWNDFELSQIYRAETLDYCRFCLGLSNGQCWSGQEPSSTIIRNFNEIGKAIRDVYNMGQ